MDADGEVAQSGHDPRKTAGADLGVVFTEGAVPDVVEKIFNLPVAADPGGELGAGRGAGRQAGDQVDAFDGELAGGEVLSPARDLECLLGVGVVEVREGSGLQAPDLVAVVGPDAVVVVQNGSPPEGKAVGGSGRCR